jgi:threonine synthase
VLYLSTRGRAPELSFAEALISGLAPDGGLYLPAQYPSLGARQIAALAGCSYRAVAHQVVAPFLDGDLQDAELCAMLDAAYAHFRHAAVTPLTQIDSNLFLLELFHGPTLAFKDVAMQLLAPLMDHLLKATGQRATIVAATSGDTGAAAIEAFRGLSQVDVFILFPQGRVSEVQRRQMTTVSAENVHTIALEGTFDDAQAIVKGLFNHARFRQELSLAGVNSINWARILAQIVYYFVAAVALGAPHRSISFCVPTGNFGDIFAGYVAKRMGLPISRLVIATNSNDILARALADGEYRLRDVRATQSPSMDIQISSNFERLLFEAYGRDPQPVTQAMAQLHQARRFTIAPAALMAIRNDFDAAAVGEAETTEEIRTTFVNSAYVLDPHSAVAVAAARRHRAIDRATPMVVLATAHPSKFPDAVAAVTGTVPSLPAHLQGLFERREHINRLPNDQGAVEAFLRSHARAANENVSA